MSRLPVITYFLSQEKYAAAMENTLAVKIVTPDWITSSVKNGSLLPTTDFNVVDLISSTEPSSTTSSTTTILSSSGSISNDECLSALLNQKEFAELLDSELGTV